MINCIIFGTGSLAEIGYYKLKDTYNIIGFTDNETEKDGRLFFNLPIFPINKLKYLDENYNIIIASTYYKEIANQILSIRDKVLQKDILYLNPGNYLLMSYIDLLEDYSNNKIFNINKNLDIKRVLFVQTNQCIRTYRIATVLKEVGIDVDFAYLKEYNFSIKDDNIPYSNIIPINSLDKFLSYVNKENYDIIHSSNEPDCLTVLLLNSNKKVVHDTHDMMSLRSDVDIYTTTNEYIANKNSDGNIFPSEGIRNVAIKKYNLQSKNTLVLGNYILESQKPQHYLEKLSSKDKEIHCVYEGGLTNIPYSHKFLEKIFLKISLCGIHVHFYCPPFIEFLEYYKWLDSQNEYLHYEGFCSLNNLITQLTQYDVGLSMFNINERNRLHIHYSSPNKFFDYLSAGLPIAIDNIAEIQNLAIKYKIGKYLNINGDIKKQLFEIKEMKVEKNFLSHNNLTMNSQADNLLKFYNSII